MKKIFLLGLLLFVSCKNESALTYSKEFDLKGFSKIEVLSYPDRMLWDTLESSEEVIKDGRLNFDSTFVKERVILSEKQSSELIKIFCQDSCYMEKVTAPCFDPRDMILFRDNKNKIIAYKEFCFECSNSRSSKNLSAFDDYCIGDIYMFINKLDIDRKAVGQEEKKIIKKKYGR